MNNIVFRHPLLLLVPYVQSAGYGLNLSMVLCSCIIKTILSDVCLTLCIVCLVVTILH